MANTNPTRQPLNAQDKAVYEAIAVQARTARHPGIKTLRGYALQDDIVAIFASWNEASVYEHITRLLRADVVRHSYERDGVHLFVVANKGLAFNNDGTVIVVTIPE